MRQRACAFCFSRSSFRTFLELVTVSVAPLHEMTVLVRDTLDDAGGSLQVEEPGGANRHTSNVGEPRFFPNSAPRREPSDWWQSQRLISSASKTLVEIRGP